MKHSIRNRGILLTVISTFGFSLYPILGKLVFSGGANLYTTLFVRFTLGALFFWIVMYFRERIPKLNPRSWIILLFMGGIMYASMSGLYLSSVLYIPASLAALIFYTYPMLVSILSIVAKQEAFSWPKMIGVLISSVGLILVLGLSFKGVNPLGVLLAFGAAITYSCYIITGNIVLKEVSPLLISAVVSTGAAVTYGLAGARLGYTWHLSFSTWLEIFGIGLFCSILAILTFFYGLKAIGPTTASVISTLEPLMTFVFAALLFAERLSVIQGMGGILVILGGLGATHLPFFATILKIEKEFDIKGDS